MLTPLCRLFCIAVLTVKSITKVEPQFKGETVWKHLSISNSKIYLAEKELPDRTKPLK
jgi:hypothetical protein